MRLDPGSGEPRGDMRIATGMFRDPVYQEKVRAWRPGSGPAQRAELQALARTRGSHDAVRPFCHRATAES
jgi:hypothetical protein